MPNLMLIRLIFDECLVVIDARFNVYATKKARPKTSK